MEITDLPIELYQSILHFLSLSDVLRLRLVNKFFREVVRHFRVYEISFLGLYGESFFENSQVDSIRHGYGMSRWFDNFSNTQKRPSATNDFHDFSPINLLDHQKQHLLGRPLFNIQCLRKLKVGLLVGPFYLSDAHINQLINLEELQICFRRDLSALNIQYDPVKGPDPFLDWKFSLPKLKVLFLKRSDTWPFGLQVLASHLHSFGFDFASPYDVFHFEHPETVRRLELDRFRFFNGMCFSEICSFVNLEELWISELNGVEEKVLSAFPCLKILKIAIRRFNEGGLSSTRLHLNECLTRLIERNIQVFCYGVRLTDARIIERLFNQIPRDPIYYLGCPSENRPIADLIKFFIENSEKTEDNLNALPLIDCQMDYKWFYLDQTWFPISVDLILRKFAHLRAISISSKIDYPDRLSRFLAGCKRLGKLHIENAELGQTFFDQLPSITSLYCLQIYQNRILNFRFIYRMFRLKRLCSDHHLLTAIRNGDIELARFAGMEFRYIERASYYFDAFDCFIYRNEDPPENWKLKANLYGKQSSWCFPLGAPKQLIERVYSINEMNNHKFLRFFDKLTKNAYAPSSCRIL